MIKVLLLAVFVTFLFGGTQIAHAGDLPCLSTAGEARAHYGSSHRPRYRLVNHSRCWFSMARTPKKSEFNVGKPAAPKRVVAALTRPQALPPHQPPPAIAAPPAPLPAPAGESPIVKAHQAFTEPAVSPEDAAALWGAIRALVGERATLVVDFRDRFEWDGKPVRVIRPATPEDLMLIWPARSREDGRERPAAGRD